MNIEEIYRNWLIEATEDPDIISELKSIKDKKDEINDRFYRELEFGTAGIRGVIGAGTNRMNIYTVGRATQGIADYINSVKKGGSVAISYDSRINSTLFAKTAASVFAANGIKVYIYKELMPVPALSFATRYLKCDAGAMITASHNPSKYNGYKIYGPDGCQMSVDASTKVLEYISKIDFFNGIKKMDFNDGINSNIIEYIDDEVIEEYLNNVQMQSLSPEICATSDLKVVYTPLCGAGNKPVRAILERIGIKSLSVVKEQELPDGNFPGAPYPNPEIREAFTCALKLAEKVKPDLLLATDPDADRVGIAVNNGTDFVLFSGNQVGALLLNYCLTRRKETGKMPNNPVAVKTIVSTDLCQKIAEDFGCELINVLTGFKYIGEQIALLEAKGEENRFILGFEESYGYLAGTYVRDKDAVVASMLICEMACYYKNKGMTLIDAYKELEAKYGVFDNSQNSYTFEGQEGMIKMKEIMNNFRNTPERIADYKVVKVLDYQTGEEKDLLTNQINVIKLPKSDVITYVLENGSSVIIRPSGTEPKVKAYFSSVAETNEKAKEISEKLKHAIKEKMS